MGFWRETKNNNNKNNKNLDKNNSCSDWIGTANNKNNKNLDENNTCSDGRSEQLIMRK